jgi:hypothetical protein
VWLQGRGTDGFPCCKLIEKLNSQLLPNRVSYRKSTSQGNPVFLDATFQRTPNSIENAVANG